MKRFSILVSILFLMQMLSAQEFHLIDTWQKNESSIEFITLSPDGKRLFVGHHDGALAIWDINKKMMVAEYHSHKSVLQTIIFNKDKTRFVTAAWDHKIILWEYPSMKMLKTFETLWDMNLFGMITPDGNSIYYGGYYLHERYPYGDDPFTAIYKIDVKTGKQTMVFDPNNKTRINYGGLTDGDFDLTGQYVVISFEKKLYFFDWQTKKIEKTVPCDYDLNNFIFQNDKAYLWGDKMLMRMELSDNKYELTHAVLAGTHHAYDGYSDMALSSDGKILVTGDDDNNVNIWDAESMIKTQILFGHTDVVRSFIFCNKDTILITAGYDGQIKIWSYKPSEPLKEDEKQQEVVFAENNIPLKIKDRGVDLQSNLMVNEEEFDIQLYDSRVEDGDSVSLNLNGHWILTDHRVTKAKKTIHVKIDPNYTNNYLILYAHNLGEISPNTAALTIIIGGQEHKLSLSSDMKKSGALNFEYKP